MQVFMFFFFCPTQPVIHYFLTVLFVLLQGTIDVGFFLQNFCTGTLCSTTDIFNTHYSVLYETQHKRGPASQVPAHIKCSNSQPTHIAYRSLYFPVLAELIKDTVLY